MSSFLWWTGAVFWGIILSGALAVNVMLVICAFRGNFIDDR